MAKGMQGRRWSPGRRSGGTAGRAAAWLIRGARTGGDGGFTMVEVMTTVVCIGILGAIAVPRLQGYVLESRLNGAKPYLMEVAARNRMTAVETGTSCCTAGVADVLLEDTLNNSLPASLAEAGDFCFMLIAVTSEFAYQTGAVSGTDFEVWAVLRGPAASSTVQALANSKTCTVSTTTSTAKAQPTGWVRASTPVLPGRVGQAVVFHYPPPPNGANTPNAGGPTYVWQDGIATNALVP